MQTSLKEAASELAARIAAGADRRFPVMGLRGAANALMLREMALRLDRPILAIASLPAEAEALAGDLAFFLGAEAARRIHLMRSWEVKPLAHLSPPADAQAARMAALYAMLRTPAPVIVASAEALLIRTIPRAAFNESVIEIAAGDSLDREALLDALAACGYQRVPQTEEPGDFSVRGGIVDVFSPLYAEPIRIELEDDIVTSLRHFDAASQRSAAEIARAAIVRARCVPAIALKERRLREAVALRAAEIGMVRKEAAELTETIENGLLFPGAELLMPYAYGAPLGSAFDYLPDNALLWLSDPGRIAAEAARFADRVAAEAAAAMAKPAFHPALESLFVPLEKFEAELARFPAVEAGALVTIVAPRKGQAVAVEVKSAPGLRLGANQLHDVRTAPSFEPLAVELGEVRRGQGRSLMVVEGSHQAARLRRHLEAYGLEVNTECKSFAALLEWPDFRPAIIEGGISAGAALPADGLYLHSEEEIFGEPRARRRARPVSPAAMLNLEELKPGDPIVHIDHGVGRYRGLKHLKVSDAEGDFLNLEYAGADTLYVPVERINLVQRYVGGGEDGAPKLDKLGGSSWDKVKRRTKQAVLAMAAELLEIYAAREVMEGHAYPPPGRDYEEFAARFEFEPTPDQQSAIDDVLGDLARTKPMDRLICGDAGFGKTEVALRAAFIAAMDGRQIALLAPTTILAEQHWNTFRERFKDYPVRVEMVSRFRAAKENRETIEEAARGKIDIVVGTHRLLSADVQFPRLGLLIIDEEHRFGVADK
ncbi:MAG: DEAD/DEAH box helicase, partial [Candidatus Binataceae bacterium]